MTLQQSITRTLLLLLAFTFPAAAFAGDVLMHSSSEHAPKAPASVIPQRVLDLVLPEVGSTDAEQLQRCMQEFDLSKDEVTKLFIAVKLDLNLDGNPDYFVRPAVEPHCMAFYGAHLFMYWFITTDANGKAQIVFHTGGDDVEVLSTTTNGWHEIVTSGYTATTSTEMKWVMVDGAYKAASCTIYGFDDGKMVPKGSCNGYDGSHAHTHRYDVHTR